MPLSWYRSEAPPVAVRHSESYFAAFAPGSAVMCGIVGLFFKRGAARSTLGPLLVGMLSQMAERGPDSTGFALYGDAAPEGAFKATLHAANVEYDWAALETELSAAFLLPSPARRYNSHAVFTIASDQQRFFAWLARHRPELGTFGIGERIEVFKDVGLPDAVARPARSKRSSRRICCRIST
jgi:glutamate synthase domain-containing protein 1